MVFLFLSPRFFPFSSFCTDVYRTSVALGALGGGCRGGGIISSERSSSLGVAHWWGSEYAGRAAPGTECCFKEAFKAVPQKTCRGEPDGASAVNWASAALAEGQELLQRLQRCRVCAGSQAGTAAIGIHADHRSCRVTPGFDRSHGQRWRLLIGVKGPDER